MGQRDAGHGSAPVIVTDWVVVLRLSLIPVQRIV
jgi:hypothetical protein